MLRAMEYRALFFLLCFSLVACMDASSTAPAAVCDSTSGADEPTTAECPFPRRCVTSDDCPLGTACLKCPGDGTCDKATEGSGCPLEGFEDGDTVCLLSSVGSIGLVDGFEVSEFSLKRAVTDPVALGSEPREADKDAVYEFAAPGDARFVHCALFACPPEIVPVGEDEYVIANFDRCVLAHEVFSASAGFFDLTRPDYGYPQDEDGKICPSRPVATSLQVGCWAYGLTSVMGATLLLPVAAEDVIYDYTAGFDGPVPDECHMTPCHSDMLSIGGACGEACVPRCVSGADCPEEYGTICWHGVVEYEGQDEARVRRDTYSYLGVCHDGELQ